jgi:hypothetical protein
VKQQLRVEKERRAAEVRVAAAGRRTKKKEQAALDVSKLAMTFW